MKAAALNDATEQLHERFGVHPNLLGGAPELDADGPVVARGTDKMTEAPYYG